MSDIQNLISNIAKNDFRKRLFFSIISAIPFALFSSLYLFKVLFRQTEIILAILSVNWILLSFILFFVYPVIHKNLQKSNPTRLLIWLGFELLMAFLVLSLMPFKSPVLAYDNLLISPKSSRYFEMAEIRINNEVQPLDGAILTGQSQLFAGKILIQDSDGQIQFSIKRPYSVASEPLLIFSTGPDCGYVQIDYGRFHRQINLLEPEYGEMEIRLPSMLPFVQIDWLIFLLDTLCLAIAFIFTGIVLFPPLEIKTKNYLSNFASQLHILWNISKQLILPPLVLYSLLPSLISIQFPMELELRESTKWLHALALQAGINIYDSSQTAFINMSHGPMDAIIKSLLVWIGNPTLALRWAVLVFPLLIAVIAYILLPKESSYRLEHGLVAAFTLQLILIANNAVIIIGQTETAAMVFMALTLFLFEIIVRNKNNLFSLSFFAGITWTSTFLINWRYGPILLATAILFLVRIFIKFQKKRMLVFHSLAAAVGAGLVFLFILIKYFDANLLLYYQHFFGFYRDLGEKLFLRDFLVSQSTGWLFVMVILIFFLYNQNHSALRPFSLELATWTGGIIFIYITTSIAFYLNGAGGGSHYHYPIIIFLWFMFLRYYENIRVPKAILSPLIILLLLISNSAQSAVPPLLGMKDGWNNAVITRSFLRELNASYSLWTEDIHLYKDKWTGETVDMGDYDSFYRSSGLFPPEFNALVDDHFVKLTSTQPEALIISPASSPELIKFAKNNNYHQVFHYIGWDNLDFGVWYKQGFNFTIPKL